MRTRDKAKEAKVVKARDDLAKGVSQALRSMEGDESTGMAEFQIGPESREMGCYVLFSGADCLHVGSSLDSAFHAAMRRLDGLRQCTRVVVYTGKDRLVIEQMRRDLVARYSPSRRSAPTSRLPGRRKK